MKNEDRAVNKAKEDELLEGGLNIYQAFGGNKKLMVKLLNEMRRADNATEEAKKYKNELAELKNETKRYENELAELKVEISQLKKERAQLKAQNGEKNFNN